MTHTNSIARVHFHGIGAGGDGVGRDDEGMAVFAPYSAPGDVASVEITEAKKSFARGRIVELQEPSPQRVAPPCRYYLPSLQAPCGGCQLQHLDYAAQLAAKRSIVADALRRIGGQSAPTVHNCIASPLAFGYRNKADFVVGMVDGAALVGYYARGSHHIVDIERCPLQCEPNNLALTAVREAMGRGLVTPFDAATGRGILRRVIARTGSNGELLITIATTGEPWPRADAFCEYLLERLPALVGVLRREPRGHAKVLTGRDWLMESLGGLRLRATGEAFFQVNSELTPRLLEIALGYAAVREGDRAIDLFCGAGLFALGMARAGASVLGIELNRDAVLDAQFNAMENELSAEFRGGSAMAGLGQLQAGEFDTLLLDPPREGAAECIEEIVHLLPGRIVYVSCDPATLARDIKALSPHYTLIEATPLDMFPQTAHVETVALLSRR